MEPVTTVPAVEPVIGTVEPAFQPTCNREDCKCAHEQGIVIAQNADGSFSQYSVKHAQDEMVKLENLKKQLGNQI